MQMPLASSANATSKPRRRRLLASLNITLRHSPRENTVYNSRGGRDNFRRHCRQMALKLPIEFTGRGSQEQKATSLHARRSRIHTGRR